MELDVCLIKTLYPARLSVSASLKRFSRKSVLPNLMCDEASGGLALAAQWELLCPGSAPRSVTPVAATTVDACTGKLHCDSNKLFSAEVIQFNAGPVGGGRHHAVRMIVRFHNLTNQPIILAYVTGSSTMIDNLGNGYTWGRPIGRQKSRSIFCSWARRIAQRYVYHHSLQLRAPTDWDVVQLRFCYRSLGDIARQSNTNGHKIYSHFS